MYEMTDDTAGPDDLIPGDPDGKPALSEADLALVKQKIQTIKDDKRHHDKAFKRMHRDMQVAMWGAEESWISENYVANIVGRHIKMKTAALYAKNPKATARRRNTLDFAVWDENPASLQLAYQTVQQGNAIMAQAAQMGQIGAVTADPAAAVAPGLSDPAASTALTPMGMPAPQIPLPPGFEQAQAVLADFKQGYERRQQIKKYGETMERLFEHAMREQKPVDFKRSMKHVVRRACTTGVGYVKLGFHRETAKAPGLNERMADLQSRIDHLKTLAVEMAEGEINQNEAEAAELQRSLDDLQQQPEVVVREGLAFDFPQSTKVIPDRLCKILEGFVGARHITIEYIYTSQEVKEIFGVDLKDSYTGYQTNDSSTYSYSANDVLDDEYQWNTSSDKKNQGLVCVWEHYDKISGLVYYLADGYDGYLREPAAPDVFVETFWPVYALTFNAVESEKHLFPPSDVALLLDMQREYNRSRQGLREHREAARPRWVYSNGAFDEEDEFVLKKLKPFQSAALNIPPEGDIAKILQAIPVPGVDPNLYETGQIFNDMQLVGGSQEANYGGVAKATATESAIAANSTNASDASSIDDLDGFLSSIARAAGQILQKEMSTEQVTKIVGPGAVWFDVTLADIADELFLEVEAGSTGKPNQAVEIDNWKQMVPLLIQVPGLDPQWLLKEMLRRLDDRMDVTEAIAAGIPSIIAQNSQSQPGLPGSENPNMQGGQGRNNAPQAPQESGSGPAFGSNQV